MTLNNKILFNEQNKFALATALTKRMMTLLAQCARALLGRSTNYLHM